MAWTKAVGDHYALPHSIGAFIIEMVKKARKKMRKKKGPWPRQKQWGIITPCCMMHPIGAIPKS